MANTTYLDKFENIVKAIEHAGGHIGTEDSLTDAELRVIDPLLTQDSCSNDQLEEVRETASAQYKHLEKEEGRSFGGC